MSKSEKSGHSAIVIMVNNRFYAHYNSKTDRIQTAWSLAGSTLYLKDQEMAMCTTEEMLKRKGYEPVRREVFLSCVE